jgi:hypothetical protein
MIPFGTSRRLAGALAVLLAAAIQVGCGGSGRPEVVTEAVRTKARALSAPAIADTQTLELPGYLSPQVVGLTKVAERRVSRTVFDYDFVVQLKNGSRALSNVQAVVTGSGAGTTILTAAAQVGEVPADATVTSTGKVTIRHDRAQPFSAAALAWAFRGVVTASKDPIIVRRADPAMIRTLSGGQKVVMSQLVAVTDGSQSLDQDLAMFGQLGAEVIGRVPEGNLYQLLVPSAVDEGTLVAALERVRTDGRIVGVSFNSIFDVAAGSGSYRPDDAFVSAQTDALIPANITVAWNTIRENFSYFDNQIANKRQLKPVVVGVIDRGFTEDLTCEMDFEKLWGPEGGDDHGLDVSSDGSVDTHGMHVAGIIAALGNNRTDCAENRSQIAGVAWQARPRVKAAKADHSLAVTLSHISRLARGDARVINISLGPDRRGDFSTEARTMASFLKNVFRYYDFLLVFAAGNDFDEAIWRQPLANLFRPGWGFDDVKSRVLIVANVDTSEPSSYLSSRNSGNPITDAIWSGNLKIGEVEALWCNDCGPSNYGVGVEIAAPGTNILSLGTAQNPGVARPSPSERVKSGTSMAAPLVSGVAATAMAINPTLAASQVKRLILENAGAEISFESKWIPDLFSKKNLEKQEFRHRIVDMDKVVRAASELLGERINPALASTTTVSVTLSCEFPVVPATTEPTIELQSIALSLNARISEVSSFDFRRLQEGWAEPTLPFDLRPGRYLLQLQSGVVGGTWSSSETVYPVYFEVTEPLASEMQRIRIAFSASSRAACDTFADMPYPTVRATNGILVPTAGPLVAFPAIPSTDVVGSWSFASVAWWVKEVVWKFGATVDDVVVQVRDGALAATKYLLSLPGLREVAAVLTDGTGEKGVTLSFPVFVSQGATVSSFESVGPVTAGLPATFTLKGTKLPPGLVVRIQDCGVAAELAQGGTDTQRQFTCTFPASAQAGIKDVGIGAVGSLETPFERSLTASAISIELVRAKVTAVTAAPSPSSGAISLVTVSGANLPATAFALVVEATCDRSTVSARPDGSGFTQTCTFGPTAGTKGVTVMSSADASGFIIDDSKSLTVSAQQQPATSLFDEFSGTAIDATMWSIDGWDATGNDYTAGQGRGIGSVTIGNGVVEFGRLGRISTKNKITFSGNGGIVIEGRMAGPGPLHDTSVMLVDSTGGDQILMGDTNYGGWGFYALGVGSYKLKEASTIGDPTAPLTLGSTTTAFMEYRLTIIGDKIKIERGPTLANITQTGTGTLGRSIAGRQFHISIGATWAYYPGTWDWIRVKAEPGAPAAGLVGHWSFDNCNAQDAGPNALHASISGAPLCVPGKKGNAYRLNGASDWFTVPTSAAMPSSGLTMSYWLHREGRALTGYENYISKEPSFQAYLTPNATTQFGIHMASAGFWTGWGDAATLLPTLNDWVHYAFTYDNATRRANTYRNGVLVYSIVEADPRAVLSTSNQPMFIGRNGSANVYHVKGLLDDVRVYGRALSADEVLQLAR